MTEDHVLTEAELEQIGNPGQVFNDFANGKLRIQRFEALSAGPFWFDLPTDFDEDQRVFSTSVSYVSSPQVYALVWSGQRPILAAITTATPVVATPTPTPAPIAAPVPTPIETATPTPAPEEPASPAPFATT